MTPETLKPQAAPLLRRLAAMLYDGVLLFGLCFLGTLLTLPLAKNDAFSANNPFFTLYLLSLCFLYLGYCWTKNGQTLGMQTWRIKIVTREGKKPNWSEALQYFVFAIIGYGLGGITLIGYFLSADKILLHEHLSKMRQVVLLSKNTPNKKNNKLGINAPNKGGK